MLLLYPFFYCIGVWSIINHILNVDLTQHEMIAVVLLFYAGWCLTRGANLQKYWFKRNPELPTCFFGLIHQTPVRPNSRILCSGFWGLSRHINYFGEITQAIAIALPGYFVSGSFVPFLYPLYYVALFIPRAQDDGKICAAKYGQEWD
mmetsp:Transcript_48004/g.56081  ORF Transcript_48004/g.56081 Transcript_48004/m.56081 type:complete len:148 (+) Transcript_48004:339-782(+)